MGLESCKSKRGYHSKSNYSSQILTSTRYSFISFIFFYVSVFLQFLILLLSFHISAGHFQVCLGNTKLVSGFLLPFLSYPPSLFISLAPVWPFCSYFSIKILYILLNQLMASQVSPFGNVSADPETLRAKLYFCRHLSWEFLEHI